MLGETIEVDEEPTSPPTAGHALGAIMVSAKPRPISRVHGRLQHEQYRHSARSDRTVEADVLITESTYATSIRDLAEPQAEPLPRPPTITAGGRCHPVVAGRAQGC